MELKDILLSNTGLTRYILENIDPGFLVELGKKNSLSVFNEALKTKRYQELMHKNNLLKSEIKSYFDFNKLPIIDKQNYIIDSDINDLIKVKLENNYTIECSGGYSGKAYFWPRYSGQDDGFINYLRLGLIKIFRIDKKSTLVVNTFALGTWVTGVKFAINICKLANTKDLRLTAVNTGTNINDALKVVSNFGRFYDQIIIVGYPPFINTLIRQLNNSKDILNKINIISGGEGFVEEWRDELAKVLNIRIENFESLIVSAYGSADTGLEIGYEMPLTIILRRLLWKKPELIKELLPQNVSVLPHFFQYNPLNIWVEEIKGELIFTADSGIPIVRYNLHDKGGILQYNEVVDFLSRHINGFNQILSQIKPFHLPICYVYGRIDGSVSLDGANIYIQDIQKVFSKQLEIKQLVSKKFNNIDEILSIIPNKSLSNFIFTTKVLDNNFKIPEKFLNDFRLSVDFGRLLIQLELNDGLKFDEDQLKILKDCLKKAFIILLYTNSSGYKEISDEDLDSADILIDVSIYHQGIFSKINNSIKKKYIEK